MCTSPAPVRRIAFGALLLALTACHTPAGPAADASESGSSRSSTARALWTDEPAGLSTLTDRVWTSLTASSWSRRDGGDDRIVHDPSVSESPDTVLEYVYPAGFAGGRAPATHFYPLAHLREVFVGLQWKVSDPWQGHASGVNKIQFLYTAGSDVAMVMYGPPGGPYEVRVLPQWPEHTSGWLRSNAAPPVALGRWHRIEWYLKYESTRGAGDGIIRWWVDGTLDGDFNQLRFPDDAGFVEYQMSPTWGGVGDTKAESDFYRFHRSYISGR